MEEVSLKISEYKKKRKNGESNYDIFAQIASEQGATEYFGKLCYDDKSLSNLVDIFSIEKIIEEFKGKEFISIAKLYNTYIKLKNARNKDSLKIIVQTKAVLAELNKHDLPVPINEIRKEVTRRAVEIPTGDNYMDNFRKWLFKFDCDWEEAQGDFYLLQALQAQREGVDNFLSNISMSTLYKASTAKIDKLCEEKRIGSTTMFALEHAKQTCVVFYNRYEDKLPPQSVRNAIKLLKAYKCLVTKEEYISEVKKAIAKLNADTNKSPITLSKS